MSYKMQTEFLLRMYGPPRPPEVWIRYDTILVSPEGIRNIGETFPGKFELPPAPLQTVKPPAVENRLYYAAGGTYVELPPLQEYPMIVEPLGPDMVPGELITVGPHRPRYH